MIELTFGILIGLIIVTNGLQFLFWSSQNQKLVDKLMSRNYAEYIQLTSPLPSKPVESPIEDTEDVDTLNHLIVGM